MAKANSAIRKQLVQILYRQLIIMIVLTLIVFLLQGIQKGSSMMLGGLAYWLPTVAFLIWVSRYAGAQAATKFFVAFFMGEMIKLVLSGALFLLMIKYFSIDVLFGLLGLALAVVAFWVASIGSLFYQGVAR